MEKAYAIIVVLVIGGLFYQRIEQPQPIIVQEPIAVAQEVVIEKWAVTTSPHSAVSVEKINEVIGILQANGLTKQGTAYLTGNFIAESHLIPCGNYGDGGLAQGLAQWHPGRRYDMPCGLVEQIEWALNVEMPRDAKGMGYTNLSETLKDPSATPESLLVGIQKYERYGIAGNRRWYGEEILKQLGA
ncbi:MAG: phage tail tip lysozyme [Proteobacteria bacterium]|jgi:hypothetical protein|nr:phage tail tip lysozyme [Pseudomonadota bacterium]